MYRSASIAAFVSALVIGSTALAQTPPEPRGRIFGSDPPSRQAPAAPAPPPRELVRLEYRAAAGCPDEQGLRTAIAARMGYDPVSNGAARLLRVVLSRTSSGFMATAQIRDTGGRVVWSRPPLADPDCRALVDVMGLSLKFAIDPASAGATQPEQVPQAAPIIFLPAAAPTRDQSMPTEPAPSPRPLVRFGLRGAGTIGTAPAPTGAISADIGVGWPHFSLALEGRGDIPITSAVSQVVQLQTVIAAGSLVPCGHYGWFVGCAIVSVGGMWAEGVSSKHPATGSAVYAVAGPRVGLEWPIPAAPAFALRLSLDALVTLHPITARVDGQPVWSAPPFAGLLGGGLVVRL